MFAAVMLPESGGTVMILDILHYCKIMGLMMSEYPSVASLCLSFPT